jgi:FlaA1/EpsC-like NDP-sugar epimerase
VTGAGTLGTEIVVKLLERNTIRGGEKVYVDVMDHSEEAIWRLQERLKKEIMIGNIKRGGPLPMKLHLGDIRNFESVKDAVGDCNVVIHTAALKHVILTNEAPMECVRTNVDGTWNLLRAFQGAHVSALPRFCNVSSDKACMPSNIYGESKRMTETLTRTVACMDRLRPWFFSCRFGNFLGSHGSVFDRWKEQRKDKRIVLTDPNMNRFFIKPKEVADFILKGIELEWKYGDVHIPYMKVINMGTLAEVVADQWGIEIETIGGIKGEKNDEMLVGLDETPNLALEQIGFCIKGHQTESGGSEMITTAYMPALSKEDTLKYVKEVIE